MNGELNGRDVISTRISGILKEAYWKLKMKRTHLMTWLDEFRTTLLHSSFHRFLHPTVTLQHPLILCFRATKKKKNILTHSLIPISLFSLFLRVFTLLSFVCKFFLLPHYYANSNWLFTFFFFVKCMVCYHSEILCFVAVVVRSVIEENVVQTGSSVVVGDSRTAVAEAYYADSNSW